MNNNLKTKRAPYISFPEDYKFFKWRLVNKLLNEGLFPMTLATSYKDHNFSPRKVPDGWRPAQLPFEVVMEIIEKLPLGHQIALFQMGTMADGKLLRQIRDFAEAKVAGILPSEAVFMPKPGQSLSNVIIRKGDDNMYIRTLNLSSDGPYGFLSAEGVEKVLQDLKGYRIGTLVLGDKAEFKNKKNNEEINGSTLHPIQAIKVDELDLRGCNKLPPHVYINDSNLPYYQRQTQLNSLPRFLSNNVKTLRIDRNSNNVDLMSDLIFYKKHGMKMPEIITDNLDLNSRLKNGEIDDHLYYDIIRDFNSNPPPSKNIFEEVASNEQAGTGPIIDEDELPGLKVQKIPPLLDDQSLNGKPYPQAARFSYERHPTMVQIQQASGRESSGQPKMIATSRRAATEVDRYIGSAVDSIRRGQPSNHDRNY